MSENNSLEEKKNESVQLNRVFEMPCLFSDTFNVALRTDKIALVEMLAKVPSGHQVNARTMMSLEALKKLHSIIGDIIQRSQSES